MANVEREKRGHDMEKIRYPSKVKFLPKGPDYILNLSETGKKGTLEMMMRASADSRALKISFVGKKAISEEFFSDRLEGRTEDGEVAYHFIQDFGVYGVEKVFELKTPVEGVTLMVRRNEAGDVTFWTKGHDISKAQAIDGPKPYVITHKENGNTIGYTIKDFLQRVNETFAHLVMQLQA